MLLLFKVDWVADDKVGLLLVLVLSKEATICWTEQLTRIISILDIISCGITTEFRLAWVALSHHDFLR